MKSKYDELQTITKDVKHMQKKISRFACCNKYLSKSQERRESTDRKQQPKTEKLYWARMRRDVKD
ncbi:hypothetical protein MA16_Dca027630 [Dendrobium catenatum]|uniref:Uncharacterized protein n=1 Tax=Dendrobium catenatum TaxID=906689 RepID=A0A2I0WRJ4_9ASPA|nr:hypothetical protein MA16_Dca027630 [Dendrobium catenatum]